MLSKYLNFRLRVTLDLNLRIYQYLYKIILHLGWKNFFLKLIDLKMILLIFLYVWINYAKIFYKQNEDSATTQLNSFEDLEELKTSILKQLPSSNVSNFINESISKELPISAKQFLLFRRLPMYCLLHKYSLQLTYL